MPIARIPIISWTACGRRGWPREGPETMGCGREERWSDYSFIQIDPSDPIEAWGFKQLIKGNHAVELIARDAANKDKPAEFEVERARADDIGTIPLTFSTSCAL